MERESCADPFVSLHSCPCQNLFPHPSPYTRASANTHPTTPLRPFRALLSPSILSPIHSVVEVQPASDAAASCSTIGLANRRGSLRGRCDAAQERCIRLCLALAFPFQPATQSDRPLARPF